MKLAAVTCTCDRPQAFSMLKRWVRRMRRTPDLWIVSDGGLRTADTSGMRGIQVHHLQNEVAEPGASNFLHNLRCALYSVPEGYSVAFLEDDDWYDQSHLTDIITGLGNADVVGCPELRYWHLRDRTWLYHKMSDVCSLASTGCGPEAVSLLIRAIDRAEERQGYAVDRWFWQMLQHTKLKTAFLGSTNVGLKGWPGPGNLGIGRDGSRWTPDPHAQKLWTWVGKEDMEAILT